MIILPDIHGRTFWKQIQDVDDNIVFLGDYLDPYSDEGISPEKAITNFEEILQFKRDNNDKVTLLLGNHDCGYIWSDVCQCRRDNKNYQYIKRLFMDNLSLFNIVYIVNYEEKTYILSHAGCHESLIPKDKTPEYFNELLHSTNPDDFDLLGDGLGIVSFWRGGYMNEGSVVWADIHEWLDYKEQPYQIFGHTQLVANPIITDNWACLDCRKPFRFDLETNKIEEYV